jgi:hypothetical protein
MERNKRESEMKSYLTVIAAATVAFAVSGCASQKSDKKMAKAPAIKTMTAKEVAKAFSKGSKVCSWKAGKKGKDRGTDYYYKDISATSGNADRVMGKATLQGKWSVSGDVLSLNFGIGKPQQYKLVSAGKKSYTAYLNGVKKKMTFKCK